MSLSPLNPSDLQRRRIAAGALTQAEAAVRPERDPWSHARTLLAMAGTWRKIERTRVPALLNTAWSWASRISKANDRDMTFSDIVLEGWAGLDNEEARRRIPRIKDSYWRSFATDFLPSHVARVDRTRGALLLNAFPDPDRREDMVLNAAFDLMREDPEGAVDLIARVEGVDRDDLIHTIIFNLCNEAQIAEARRLLPHIASPATRDKAVLSIAQALASTRPEEALDLVRGRSGDGVPLVLAMAGAALVDRNRVAAREKVAAAIALSPRTPERYVGYYRLYQLLPFVTAVDPELARNVLESLPDSPPADVSLASHLLDLAGAWASVDLKRAKGFYARSVAVHSPIDTDGHGRRSLPDSLDRYLAGLIREEPKEAGAILRRFGAGIETTFINKDRIVDAVRSRHPAQLLDFAEALGGPKERRSVADRLLAERIRAHPADAESWLPELKSDDWDHGHDRVATQIAVTRAHADLSGAVRILKQVRNPRSRVSAYGVVAKVLIKAGNARATSLLKDAIGLALRLPAGSERANSLVEIARVALTGFRDTPAR